ncbi:hypothetical protein [Acidicapsa ligni]|uniref:hypothetical protein n=1 Tax=Acidicapsa ligni TaxID=542300 RepID=UPI0021E0343A|nr:hypothetical protein [Acidicapsa ligni]
MTDDTTDFIQEMNLQRALSSIRALSEGSTTFLRALEDVDLAGRGARATELINGEIDALEASVAIRFSEWRFASSTRGWAIRKPSRWMRRSLREAAA